MPARKPQFELTLALAKGWWQSHFLINGSSLVLQIKNQVVLAWQLSSSLPYSDQILIGLERKSQIDDV